MPLVAKSDLSHWQHRPRLLPPPLRELCFLFTAPYSPSLTDPSSAAIPTFSDHRAFTSSHGLDVAIQVESAFSAYSISVSRGAKPVSPPVLLSDGKTAIAEVHLYGDAVLRFISCGDDGWFMPEFEAVDGGISCQELDYGIRRLDHAVGNVPKLEPVLDYLKKFTGVHDGGCWDSGEWAELGGAGE